MAEDRIRELAGSGECLVVVAELLAEEVVDCREHLGPRAVVAGQRQTLGRRRAALAEHGDVGVAEAVDRLELVADEEDVGRAGPAAHQVDDVALQPVRVLELVDHDRAEPQLLELADVRMVAQQVARVELQIFEVERRLALLRRRVLGGEQVEQLLQQLAVARRKLLERRLLQPVAGSAELERALARNRQIEIEQLLRVRAEGERRRSSRELVRGRVGIGGQAARSFVQLAEPLGDARVLAELQRQVAPGRAQRLVDAGQHLAQAGRAVGREQSEALRVTPAQNAPSALSNASPRSTAAWSSASSWKRGSRPTGNGCARRSREQKPWIVEIQAPSSRRARSWRPRACSAALMRARSSPAALRV